MWNTSPVSVRSEAAVSTALASLPLVLDWLYKAVVHPRPFWAFYYDPETIYFYDGLRLLRGELPVNVDNPATIVQILSALILAPMRHSPLVIDAFRSAAYVVVLVLQIAAIYLLMRTILRDTPSLVRIAAVWAFFAVPAVLEYNTVWSPDTLYLAAGALALAAAWRYVMRPTGWGAVLLGAAVGFCVALKFTFLVWVIAMLAAFAILRAWRDAARAIGGCVAGFVITTSPVIARYPDMFRLVTRVAFHRGAYGNAPQSSLPTIPEISAGIVRFVAAFPLWHLWAATIIVMALVVALRRRTDRPRLALLGFAITAFVLQYIATARQITPRYVIPAGVVSIALVAVAFSGIELTRMQQLLPLALSAIVLAFMLRGDLAAHEQRNANAARLDAAVRWVIGTRGVPNPVVVYSWRFPTPSYALRVLAPDDDFLRQIETRFPREGDYNPFWTKLRLPAGTTQWDFFVIAPEDLPRSPAANATLVVRAGNYLVMRRR